MNAQELISTRITLEELNHPQLITLTRIDNITTADGIMKKIVKQKVRKGMDKIFYWLQYRVEQ